MDINPLFKDILILVKGAGDLASGVAYRLKRSGFPLIMSELPAPTLVRRTVSFGEAIYSGEAQVENILARRVESIAEALQLARSETIPIMIDPAAVIAKRLKPQILVDAVMAKVNIATSLDDAPLVIALGPGFTAGFDCHAVIETNRGHRLGRVMLTGQAEPNTKTPGMVKGYTTDRVLRAPAAGHVVGLVTIGELVQPGQLIAMVGPHEIRAPFAGVLRGLIHPNVQVMPGFKIGDLDPRGVVDHCFTLSDKSLAVGGGVLEAILASDIVRSKTG